MEIPWFIIFAFPLGSRSILWSVVIPEQCSRKINCNMLLLYRCSLIAVCLLVVRFLLHSSFDVTCYYCFALWAWSFCWYVQWLFPLLYLLPSLSQSFMHLHVLTYLRHEIPTVGGGHSLILTMSLNAMLHLLKLEHCFCSIYSTYITRRGLWKKLLKVITNAWEIYKNNWQHWAIDFCYRCRKWFFWV